MAVNLLFHFFCFCHCLISPDLGKSIINQRSVEDNLRVLFIIITFQLSLVLKASNTVPESTNSCTKQFTISGVQGEIRPLSTGDYDHLARSNYVVDEKLGKEKWGLVNTKTSEILLPEIYDWIAFELTTSDGAFFRVILDGKHGLYEVVDEGAKLREVAVAKWDWISYVHDRVVMARRRGEYVVVDVDTGAHVPISAEAAEYIIKMGDFVELRRKFL